MSTPFAIGKRVKLSDGDEVTVKKLLGEGGQGYVYLVSYLGKDCALKYYKKAPGDEFYKNLSQNIENGAPTDNFLWPEAITEIDKAGCFGYVMALRPNNFVEFSAILNAKSTFTSFNAIANAALLITHSFRELHRKGYSYQDLNDGNFFFDVTTGDVLICDNDNVSPHGVNMGIKGKGRYMAPEVVLGKSMPNDLSDYFSLSIILFMLMFGNHPLEGERVAKVSCLTDAAERIIYGSEPVFLYDPQRLDNRPSPVLHRNVINRWTFFPKNIRDAFVSAFSKECMNNPNKRMPENEWIKILMQFRNQIVKCECGAETLIDISKSDNACLFCGKKIPNFLSLNVKQQSIPLLPMQKLYLSQTSNDNDKFMEVSGMVVRNANNPNLWGISNKSLSSWQVELPDGKVVAIPSGKGFPIYKGVKIKFDGVEGVII